MRPVPHRVVLGGILLVALVLASLVSFYASGSPDGLERVATDTGFASTAESHVAAGGPLADYRAKGIADERLANGVAGVAGSLVVLVLAGSAVRLLPRKAGRAERRR